MIAKVIAHGRDRCEALARVRAGLEGMAVAGPRTNAAFLHALLGHGDVVAGRMETGLIGRELKVLAQGPQDDGDAALCAGAAELLVQSRARLEAARAKAGEAWSPWSAGDAFGLEPERRQSLPLLVDGETVTFDVAWRSGEARPRVSLATGAASGSVSPRAVRVVADGSRQLMLHAMRQRVLAEPEYGAGEDGNGEAGGALRAPINGKVAKVLVAKGDKVAKGTAIAVVEAMKMEHVLAAPADGIVAELAATEGAQVVAGAVLARIG
jgi:3-methylcrotonyl-CoA carboxylase alpha subunit